MSILPPRSSYYSTSNQILIYYPSTSNNQNPKLKGGESECPTYVRTKYPGTPTETKKNQKKKPEVNR